MHLQLKKINTNAQYLLQQTLSNAKYFKAHTAFPFFNYKYLCPPKYPANETVVPVQTNEKYGSTP